MGRVEGKVAIVTGGALGIGKASCVLLAEEGAMVAVTDVLYKEGQEFTKQLQNKGGLAEFWHLDVSDEKEVEKVFAEINKKFRKIDVLVNNAGIAGVSKPTHEISEEEWDNVMAVNVKGVFFCNQRVQSG